VSVCNGQQVDGEDDRVGDIGIGKTIERLYYPQHHHCFMSTFRINFDKTNMGFHAGIPGRFPQFFPSLSTWEGDVAHH